MTHDAPLILAAALYAAALVLLYNSIREQSPGWRTLSLTFAVAGALFHAGMQISHWFGEGAQDVSLPHLLSLCALVIMLLLIASAFTRRTLYDAGLVALPIAAAVVLLEWVALPQPIPLDGATPGIALHLISSVLSFGLLSIAGVYTFFAYLADYFLRHHHINPLVRTLPALEVLEDLLFRLIAAGFLLLTISLASGVVFISDIFAQHLVHKTVLSIFAWLVFGLLLWGRWRHGWRGRLAVRLTLGGIALLVLSYFGSKFVLEILLDSNWQA